MSDPPRYHLPPESVIARQTMRDGAHIRTLFLSVQSAHANLLVLNGRADFLEKWSETYRYFHAAGFAVASWDWRGQGGSSRLGDTGAGHIDSFDRWLADMDELASTALTTLGDGPWFILAHSMGAHLALRWLADPARRHHPLRQHLRAGILISPLCGLSLAWPLGRIAPLVARWQLARRRGGHFAWGQSPGNAMQKRALQRYILTSSQDDFLDEERWLAHDPTLATGGVSWNWLAAFYASRATLAGEALETVDVPLLILLASQERLVSNADTRRMAERLPDASVETFAGAHELLREAPAMRQPVLDRIDNFIRQHLHESV